MELGKNRHVGDGQTVEDEFLPGIDLVQGIEMRIPLLLGLFSRFRRIGAPHRMVGENQHFVGPIFQR